MARARATLTLQSIGYSGMRIGNRFAINIATSLGGDAFTDTKTIENGATPPYTDTVAEGVFEVPPDGVVQVDVAAIETDEPIPDPGSGSGEIAFTVGATTSRFVKVRVNGQGGDRGKTADLRFGFVLMADASPERFTALCALLKSLLARFGGGAQADRLRTELLRIAWHETELGTRKKQSGGPARGIYQMQANGAHDALAAMRTADPAAYAEFARLGGFASTAALDDAVRKLQGASFGSNAIGNALARSDECATLAAIAALRSAFGSLPAESDVQGAADFWETNWRRVASETLKTEFAKNAQALDRIRAAIPASECGLGK